MREIVTISRYAVTTKTRYQIRLSDVYVCWFLYAMNDQHELHDPQANLSTAFAFLFSTSYLFVNCISKATQSALRSRASNFGHLCLVRDATLP